jgi:hypothetical protein
MDSSLSCPAARTQTAPLSASERKTATGLRNRAEWHCSSPTSPVRSSLRHGNAFQPTKTRLCCASDLHEGPITATWVSLPPGSRSFEVLNGREEQAFYATSFTSSSRLFQWSSEKFDNCPGRGAETALIPAFNDLQNRCPVGDSKTQAGKCRLLVPGGAPKRHRSHLPSTRLSRSSWLST